TLRALDRDVRFTDRWARAFHDLLEMMNHRLHVARCFALRRQYHAMVGDVHRSVGQPIHRLLEDAHRLTQLSHAYEVAIVDVAVRADGYVEVVRLVIEIREVLAHIVCDAGRAQHRPRQSVVHGFFRGHDAEPDRAVDPDRVARHDAVDLGDGLWEVLG